MKDILKVAAGVVLGLSIFSILAVVVGNLFLIGFLFGGNLVDSEDTDSTTSTWTQRSYTDPLDDTETRSIFIQEKNTNLLLDDSPEFYISCFEDTLEVYISWQEYIDYSLELAVRIDNGEIRQEQWDASYDETATYYPGDTQEFIDQLIDAERLVARASTYDGSEITAVFELSGLDEAILPIHSACDR